MSDDDMPQLLSRVKGDAKNIHFGNLSGPGKHRPELAQLAGQAISEWAMLDSKMSGIFVAMLGSNPGPAAAIYANFTATATQTSAIRTVAALSLTEPQRDVLEAILKVYSSVGKARNRIAHWIWGFTPDLQDSVLLCDPVHFVKYHAAFIEYEDALLMHGPTPQEPGIPKNEIWVYDARDFKAISDRIQRAIMLATGFRNLIRFHTFTGRIHGSLAMKRGYAARFQSLSNEPEIREHVARLQEDRKKTQGVPEQSRPEDPPQK